MFLKQKFIAVVSIYVSTTVAVYESIVAVEVKAKHHLSRSRRQHGR